MKGAGCNLWSSLSLFSWLGCPMLFRVISCTSGVLYLVIIHFTQPNRRLEDTVKCILQCCSTSHWIFHNIKSRYGCQWAILKLWVTFAQLVRRNSFLNESTSRWTLFQNMQWVTQWWLNQWWLTHVWGTKLCTPICFFSGPASVGFCVFDLGVSHNNLSWEKY